VWKEHPTASSSSVKQLEDEIQTLRGKITAVLVSCSFLDLWHFIAASNRWLDAAVGKALDLQLLVIDSSRVCTPLRNGLRQATCVPLSSSSITCYQSMGIDTLRLER